MKILFHNVNGTHFQQAEVSLIKWPAYYKGSSSQVLVCAIRLGDLFCHSVITRQLTKNLKLSESWRYPYVAMGLHIPILLLISSASCGPRVPGLYETDFSLPASMSWSKGVKISHAAWKQQNTLVRQLFTREPIAKEVHMYGKSSQTLSSSRRTKCCWSPLILSKHTLALVNRPWLRKELFFSYWNLQVTKCVANKFGTRIEQCIRVQDKTLICFWDFNILVAHPVG